MSGPTQTGTVVGAGQTGGAATTAGGLTPGGGSFGGGGAGGSWGDPVQTTGTQDGSQVGSTVGGAVAGGAAGAAGGVIAGGATGAAGVAGAAGGVIAGGAAGAIGGVTAGGGSFGGGGASGSWGDTPTTAGSQTGTGTTTGAQTGTQSGGSTGVFVGGGGSSGGGGAGGSWGDTAPTTTSQGSATGATNAGQSGATAGSVGGQQGTTSGGQQAGPPPASASQGSSNNGSTSVSVLPDGAVVVGISPAPTTQPTSSGAQSPTASVPTNPGNHSDPAPGYNPTTGGDNSTKTPTGSGQYNNDGGSAPTTSTGASKGDQGLPGSTSPVSDTPAKPMPTTGSTSASGEPYPTPTSTTAPTAGGGLPSGSGTSSGAPYIGNPQSGTPVQPSGGGIPMGTGAPGSYIGTTNSGDGVSNVGTINAPTGTGDGVSSGSGMGNVGSSSGTVHSPTQPGLPTITPAPGEGRPVDTGSGQSQNSGTVSQSGANGSQSGVVNAPGSGLNNQTGTTASPSHGGQVGTTADGGYPTSQTNPGSSTSNGSIGPVYPVGQGNVQTNHPTSGEANVQTGRSPVTAPVEVGTVRNNDGLSPGQDVSISTGNNIASHGGMSQPTEIGTAGRSTSNSQSSQYNDTASTAQSAGVISNGHTSAPSNANAAAASAAAADSVQIGQTTSGSTFSGQSDSSHGHGKHHHGTPHSAAGHQQAADPSIHIGANGQNGAAGTNHHSGHHNTSASGQNGASVSGHHAGWLDMASAHLGGGRAFEVTPPPAKQQVTNTDQQTQAPVVVPGVSANQNSDVTNQVAYFDPAPFDSAARSQPADQTVSGGTYQDDPSVGTGTSNLVQPTQDSAPSTSANQPNWFDMVSQSFEAANHALSTNENIVRHIEEDLRTVREISEDRIRKEESEKLIEQKHNEIKDKRAQDEKHLLEEKERHDKQEKEQREKRLADEMMTMLALRKESESITRTRVDRARAEREMMQDVIRKENNQEKYIVKQAEDLSNVARRKFMNPSISQLIYELNPGKVDVRWVNGQPVYTAKPGVTLVLPSQKQVKEWLHTKGNVGKNKGVETAGHTPQAPGMMGKGQSSSDERRANIEKILGKIKDATEARSYAVRLGDTLRSVAMKHPELRDVSLWKLLAEKNGLPSDIDNKGAPLAVLIRGSSIVLPTAEEIEEYRVRNSATSRSPQFAPAVTAKMTEMQNVATKLCHGCKRLLSSNSSICPACGFVFAQPAEPTITGNATTFNLPDAPTTLTLNEQSKTQVSNPQDVTTVVDMESSTGLAGTAKRAEVRQESVVQRDVLTAVSAEAITNLNDTCRLIKTNKELNGKVTTYHRLEVLHEAEWMPVLSYECGQESAMRHEYSKDGRKKSIKIDLPAGAVGEMVENELSQKWQDYCNRYLTGRRLSA